MPSNPNEQLATNISEATGVDRDSVGRVLSELANQAYANARKGFVLPGFGKFTIVSGADASATNPFTGKPVVFRAPLEVEFILDTAAKKSLLAGAAEPTEIITGSIDSRPLSEVRLSPNSRDLDAIGLKPQKTLRFKVGGEPDWLQSSEVPVCCGHAMVFYGQLDSLDNQAYCIGDMGMLYVFFCRSCSASRSVLQF